MDQQPYTRYSVSFEDSIDDTLGICRKCGEVNAGYQPDARACECECCGAMQVYGIKQAIVSGFVYIADIWDTFGNECECASLGNGLVSLRVWSTSVEGATRWMYECNGLRSKEVFATKDDAKAFCVSLARQLLDLALLKLASAKY